LKIEKGARRGADSTRLLAEALQNRFLPKRTAPQRSFARSFISTKNTGTKISTWIVEAIIPPTIGAAIGFITSEPIPLSNRIGMRLVYLHEALDRKLVSGHQPTNADIETAAIEGAVQRLRPN
jgi:hypothetical protein